MKNFYHLDAQGNDAKQIADIQDIINTPGKCDILIVASNTSDALTPDRREGLRGHAGRSV